MTPTFSVMALIVAGGRGTRFGGNCPKQYQMLNGKMVLTRTVEAFVSHPSIVGVILVIHPDDVLLASTALADITNTHNKPIKTVYGGTTRQISVFQGLQEIKNSGGAAFVLIHDAARPIVSHNLIDRTIHAAKEHEAALPGLAISDTVKSIDACNKVTATLPRQSLRSVQTPQSFAFDLIWKAHKKANLEQITDFTDDGALIEWFGHEVFIFEGDSENIKLTLPHDFIRAENMLSNTQQFITKVGMGFDVHAFIEGDYIWLGGVKIPHDQGVTAHSDGDVVLHALTDALLGTIAEGDIGLLFPPSDPQWKGAASDQFLQEAARRVRAHGGIIDHLDITLLCEKPRLTPYRDAIRSRIAEIANIEKAQVSMKATTTEKLGFTGRSEGIAAQCVATIRIPLSANS